MPKFEMPKDANEVARQELAKEMERLLGSTDSVVQEFFAAKEREGTGNLAFREEFASNLQRIREGNYTMGQLSGALLYVRQLRRAATMTEEEYRARVHDLVSRIEQDPELKKFIQYLLDAPDKPVTHDRIENWTHTLDAGMGLLLFEEVINLRMGRYEDAFVNSGREKTGTLFWEDLWDTWKLLKADAQP